MVNVFIAVVNMSITASVVVLVLLALRSLLMNRLPATFCYLLWGIVIFRLLVPWSLPNAISVFNLMNDPAVPPDGGYVVTMEYVETQGGYQPVAVPDNYNIFLVLAAAWATVMLCLICYCLLTYGLALYRSRTAFLLHEEELLARCKQLTGVRHAVQLYRSGAFDTPVVIGVWRPRIILSNNVDIEDKQVLMHIVTHELTHIKRLDHLSKIVLTIAFIIHWFNPILWLCAGVIRKDVERSCDEQVLSVLGEKEKEDYAQLLLRLCSHQRLRGYTPLAFGESAIKKRVYGALNYKRLSRLHTALLSILVLAVGLVTSTNAVAVSDGYRPVHNIQLSSSQEQRFADCAIVLSRYLGSGDTAGLLALSGRTDSYYLPTLARLQQRPLQVQGYRLYPQDSRFAYCYLRMEDGQTYVAELVDGTTGTRLHRLRQESAFAAAMTVPADSEPARFVSNLHRFGIYTGLGSGDSLPRPAVAALCIDEEYRDRVKTGEHDPNNRYLPPQWVAQAAEEYFALDDFSYTFDEELYSSEHQMYIYDPERGSTPFAEVVAQRQEGEVILVTAQLYCDPLFLYPDYSITYTLQKKK